MKFKNEGSLERTLVRDFPGCKSITQALEKAKQKPVSTPLDTPYLVMKDATQTIAKAIGDYDIDRMDQTLREKLAKIDTTSVGGVIAWETAWLEAVKSFPK